MNYIEKLAKRILAKDYDVLKKPELDKRAIFPNYKCFELTKHKKYRHFLLFYITSKRYNKCFREQMPNVTSTELLYEVAKLYSIENLTARCYINEMLKDKILIGADRVMRYDQMYSFNPEFFDAYLLIDYKTLEEKYDDKN
jgi:hypothetical protein